MAAQNGPAAAPGSAHPRDGTQAFPKRFYTEARAVPGAGGFVLQLDGRPARTPGRVPLVLPTAALADAVATEWAEVVDTVDPRRMPLTRLVNTVIDGVSTMQDAVMDEIVRFAGSDLILYRAVEPADLVTAQSRAWDGILEWSRDVLGAPLHPTEGIRFAEQPATSLARLGDVVRATVGTGPAAPYRVAALHVMTTLTGSALLALSISMGRMTSDEAWAAAHVDEDFQIARWGEDREAMERRASRFDDLKSSVRLFTLADA